MFLKKYLRLVILFYAGYGLAVEIDVVKPSKTNMVLYADFALVNTFFDQKLAIGNNQLNLAVDQNYWQLNTLKIIAHNEKQYFPENVSWSHDTDIISVLLNKDIEIVLKNKTVIKGILLAWQGNNLLLKDDNGNLRTISVNKNLLIKPKSLIDKWLLKKNHILANFILDKPTTNLQLSYINKGISVQNNYTVMLDNLKNDLQLHLVSIVNNHSNTDYENVFLTLAYGSLGQENQIMALGEVNSSPLHNLQFIPIKKCFMLHKKKSMSLNVINIKTIPYELKYEYLFTDDVQQYLGDHPQAVITFKAPQDLPAGNLQLFTTDKNWLMQGSSFLSHMAKGSVVLLPLSKIYAINIIKKKLQRNNDGQLTWQLTLQNNLNKDVYLQIKAANNLLFKDKSLQSKKNHNINLLLKSKTTKVINLTSIYIN